MRPFPPRLFSSPSVFIYPFLYAPDSSSLSVFSHPLSLSSVSFLPLRPFPSLFSFFRLFFFLYRSFFSLDSLPLVCLPPLVPLPPLVSFPPLVSLPPLVPSSSACFLSSVLNTNAAKTHPFFFPFPQWETKLRIRFRAQRRSVYSAPPLKKPSVSSAETDGVVDQIFPKIKLWGIIFSFYRVLPKPRRPSSLPLLFSSTSYHLFRPQRLPVFRPKASPAEG